MSLGNWLHSVTLGGCLAAALFSAALSQDKTQTNFPSPPKQPEQQQSIAKPTPPPIPEQPKGVANVKYYQPSCDKPKQREDANLCQQIRMAKAAEDAVWWARLQTYLGISGFFAVLVSLLFTGWAAVAAGRSAAAAERAITSQERIGQIQTKAYLRIEMEALRMHQSTKPPFHPAVSQRIYNTGQTPADDVFAVARWRIVRNEDKKVIFDEMDRDPKLEGMKTIGGQGETVIDLSCDKEVPPDLRADIMANRAFWLLDVELNYRNIFGDESQSLKFKSTTYGGETIRLARIRLNEDANPSKEGQSKA